MNFDWKQLVGSVAPVLGTTLGGPFGGMAGKFIADALGCEPEEVESKILNADPATMLQVKNLENDFKLKLRELGLKESQLHVEDRESARNLAINTTLKPQVIIASVFIIGFIIVLYSVFSGRVDLTMVQQQMANILIGILSAGMMQIMNFFYGSSAGSKEKTAQLESKLTK